MRDARKLALAALLLGPPAVHACGSYTVDEAAPDGGSGNGDASVFSPDGNPDGTAPDAGLPLKDAGAADAEGVSALNPLCPSGASVPDLAGKLPTIWAVPPKGFLEFPFQIATDADFIYWVAHPVVEGGATTEAYNGLGDGRIKRAPKSTAFAAVTIADGQASARALALDGPYVYWAVGGTGVTAVIRRALRGCSSCSVEDVVTTNIGHIDGMTRLAPGVLALQVNDGAYQLNVNSAGGAQALPPPGAYPAMVGADGALFYGFLASADVARFDLAAQKSETWAKLPAIPGVGLAGPTALATDCSDVFGARPDRSVWRAPPGGGDFTRFVDSGADEVVRASVDQRYVYLAAWNNGGVFAIDKTNRTVSKLYTGNVWRMAVDKDGVYWGEHTQGPSAGTIFFLRR